MKILIVEDNKGLAERIKKLLGKRYLIDIVHTGKDALESGRITPLDLNRGG